MPSNPNVTEIMADGSALRLVLRVTTINQQGDQVSDSGRSRGQVVVEGIIGSPEGRALGSVGDVRVRLDVGQIWQKVSGTRTKTGWQLLGGGGSGPSPASSVSSISSNQNVVGTSLAYARADHQHRLTEVAASAGDVAVFDGSNWVPVPVSSLSGGGWQEVYRHDFTDDTIQTLNSPGSTIVIDGVTYQTPSVAFNADNMVVASGSFGITANGLEIVGASNARANAGTVTGNFLIASLFDIANNTLTPFAADPTREYLIQVYVSAQNADADNEWSGAIIFRESVAVPCSNGLPGIAVLHRTGYGFVSSTGPNALEGAGSANVSPARVTYRPAALTTPPPAPYTTPNVPMIHYSNARAVMHGGAPWDAIADDFPPLSDMQFFSTSEQGTAGEDDLVLHPRFGFFVGIGHCAENLSNSYNAVVRAFRILQK